MFDEADLGAEAGMGNTKLPKLHWCCYRGQSSMREPGAWTPACWYHVHSVRHTGDAFCCPTKLVAVRSYCVTFASYIPDHLHWPRVLASCLVQIANLVFQHRAIAPYIMTAFPYTLQCPLVFQADSNFESKCDTALCWLQPAKGWSKPMSEHAEHLRLSFTRLQRHIYTCVSQPVMSEHDKLGTLEKTCTRLGCYFGDWFVTFNALTICYR